MQNIVLRSFFGQRKKISSFKPVINGLISFVRCYFFKDGIFNGIDGLTFSLTQGYFSYMKYANLLQMYKMNEKGITYKEPLDKH